jgi:hypothetical protein
MPGGGVNGPTLTKVNSASPVNLNFSAVMNGGKLSRICTMLD